MSLLPRFACIAVSTAVLTANASAQSYRIERSGGALGQTLNVRLSGPASSAYLMLPSLNAGPLPLRILDASDTRSLEVGLDLASLLVSGVFGSSAVTIPYAIPNDASLAGRQLHFHGFLFPGATRFAGALSNPIRASLGRTNAWTSRGKVLSNTTAIPAPATLRDGRVLLAGGGSGNLLAARGLDNSELYDPLRQNYTPGPKLTTARALHHAVTLQNGKVLLIGGANAQGAARRTCEIYDPATNRFSAAASMSTERAGHTATLLRDGRVLVCGGSRDLTDASRALFSAVRSAEVYNPTTNRWSNTANMSRVRLGHAAVELADGRVLVSGGATVSFIFPGVTNSAEIFNPQSNRWSGTGSMSYSGAAHSMLRLKDGRVLVVGGATLSGITNVIATNRCSIYNPSNGRWSSVANLATARTLPGLVQTPNGRVLAIGGASGSLTAPRSLATCAWLNTSTLRWSAAPSLTTARAGAIPLLRPEGMLFVVGGAGGTQNKSLDTGEILYVN